MQRSSVVLPDPEGANQHRGLVLLDVEGHALQNVIFPEALVNVLDEIHYATYFPTCRRFSHSFCRPLKSVQNTRWQSCRSC